VLRLVAHRLAGIDKQVAGEVRFFFVLLEVVAVGLADDLPVDVAQVVARDVLAVLGELDREAVKRAFVQTADVALDNRAGFQLQALQLSQRLRI